MYMGNHIYILYGQYILFYHYFVNTMPNVIQNAVRVKQIIQDSAVTIVRGQHIRKLLAYKYAIYAFTEYKYFHCSLMTVLESNFHL